jgi:demethylspheroidene O-methyltransferase
MQPAVEDSVLPPLREGKGTLADRLYQRRDKILSSPEFQRWATNFPLTRFIARARARALFDLSAGFVYSQVLASCVRLGLFAHLAQAPQTAVQLAPKLNLTLDATERLLRAATALKLTRARSKGRVGLGTLGAALQGNAGVSALIAHHDLLYADLADPVALLRNRGGATHLGGYWPYAGGAEIGAQDVARYSALMAASNAMIADQVLNAYDVGRHETMLDVGGGEGAFLQAAAARAPGLHLSLFDLPPVAARATQRLEAAGLRADCHGGSFFTDALPRGADLVCLIRVVHDHDDDAVMILLRAVRAVLPPGGVLLLAEPMSGGSAAPIADAYFGFYLLAMGSGRARSPATLGAMLEQAGFLRPRLYRTAAPMLTRLMVAHG